MNDVLLYTDGGSRGNPGPAACGAIAFDATDKAELLRRARTLGKATNNVAEYQGAVLGLELCRELGATRVHLHMDSELVVKQLKGEYKVKDANLRGYHAKVRDLISQFSAVIVKHVPRTENKMADKLVNAALDGKDIEGLE